MFRLFNNPFFALPDDLGSGAAVEDKPLSKEDTIEFLGEEDDKEETLDLPKKITKVSEEEETETDEAEEGTEETTDDLEELEKELEGPSEEQLELTTPVRRAEILKKYPTLFKDFPYLEKAYYREQQFTEMFSMPSDAKEAISKAETLDKFENDLLNGNTETILGAIKKSDENSWNKIVDEYLPTLAKVDTQAYHHVIGNIIKHTIISMVSEARTSQNESLQAAAQLLNQFVFGTSDFKQPTKLSSDEKPKTENKVDERERTFVRRQFESSRGELNTKISNILKTTIEAHIDPKKSMSDYVKKNASRETIEVLTRLVDSDGRFKVLLDKLWQNAFNNDFTKDSMDKIKSAYLSKAKTLLPSVIKKARNEALKGIGKRVKDDDDSNDESDDSISESKKAKSQSTAPRRGPIKSAKDIPAKMKTIDYLMQD